MKSTIKETSSLLRAVHATMDSIDIRGIDNQDKFVGCANAILSVAQTLEKIELDMQVQAAPNVPKEEVTNG